MRLESVTLSNFQCFGPNPITVPISSDITTVVGPNAAGKTALLHALLKMFGVSRSQRTVLRSDFHRGTEDAPDGQEAKNLFIDVQIGFPELLDGTETPEAIAPSFRRMQIKEQGKHPVCRLRLEARWEDDGTTEGEVTQELFWVDTLDNDPSEDKRHPLSVSERSLIQLYYTPASRDAAAQVRATAGALAARLLRAIEWSSGTKNKVQIHAQNLATVFESEPAIAEIGKFFNTRWSNLHDGKTDTNPRLSLVNRRFEEIVNKISVIFEKAPDGREHGLDALSDGQKSLFYFAMVAAVFDLERKAVKREIEGFGNTLRIPALTLFALEEPENHLSPYFLSRIIEQVRSMTKAGGAQAIITSHSPAVLSRVPPCEVRYCRCDPETRVSSVKRIEIPTNEEEATKFVRGAMLAYPELYFARFVLLVEGDSERIVLPRLAEALDLLIDPAFVAIIPLGGRHVQHFWRLLRQLDIPHATLLDLDLGREGGGFGRIKTAIKNLIEFGIPRAEVLRADGNLLRDGDLEEMHTWQEASDLERLNSWINCLKQYGVYFSEPLDLDLSMLSSFTKAYETITPSGGGPRMSESEAAKVVLGTAGPGLRLYTDQLNTYRNLFPAYRYHFLTRSKPATHLAALTYINKTDLNERMPTVLKELIQHITASLRRN